MKKVLIRFYVANNLGDDLFLKIVLSRYPQVKFFILAPKSYYSFILNFNNVEIIPLPFTSPFCKLALKFLNILNVSIGNKFYKLSIKKYFQKISDKIDAYLLVGGSIFMQKNNENFSNTDLVNKIINEVFYNTPKFILGANFGPYLTNSYLQYYSRIFSEFEDICFRDKYSKNIFPFLNNVRYSPDIVFQFPIKAEKKRKNSIGFSIINLSNRKDLKKYERNYLEVICGLIYMYIKEGYDVYLFSFCKLEGDENCINNILNRVKHLNTKKLFPVFYDGNYEKFLKYYGKVEMVITTRFHSMILSILFDQKIYPLIYDRKMLNVLEDLNYHGTYSLIEDIDIDIIFKIKKEISENFISFGDLPEKSQDQFSKLDQYLN